MAAQGPPPAKVRLGQLVMDVPSARSGIVSAIDCFRIARIARFAGAPLAKGAGIDLHKKVGERVEAGEPLYRIYSQLESDFTFATAMAAEASGYDVR